MFVTRFKIWHYNGTLLYDHPLKDKQELWDIQWQTFPEGTFTPKAIKAPSSGTFVEPSKPAAYRPPHARDRETKDPVSSQSYCYLFLLFTIFYL